MDYCLLLNFNLFTTAGIMLLVDAAMYAISMRVSTCIYVCLLFQKAAAHVAFVCVLT